jgi:hypothetical protein
VAGHLASLYAQLERGQSAERAHVLIERATRNEAQFHWLSPPSFAGALTVGHVLAHIDDPYETGRKWAANVWEAWATHHQQVRLWHDLLAKAK